MPKAGEVQSPGLARRLGPTKPLPAHCSAVPRASSLWSEMAVSAFQAGGPRRGRTGKGQHMCASCLVRMASRCCCSHPGGNPYLVSGYLAAREHGKCTELESQWLLKKGRSSCLRATASYYTNKKNKAQRSEVACPRSPSHRGAGQDSNPLCLQELW